MHGNLHRHYFAALEDDHVRQLAMTQRAGVRERRAARLRARRLDVRLARGVSPGTDAALAARATKLTHRSVRRGLAKQLLGLARQPQAPQAGVAAGGVPGRHGVRPAVEDLQALAQRLLAPDPVASRGVAMAHLLLADDCYPTRRTASIDAPPVAVRRALDALDGDR